MASETIVSGDKPLWRKIVDFPLVTMLIAVALFLLAIALGVLIAKQMPPLQPALMRTIANSAIVLALILAVYKFAIARLGERPHDDLGRKGAITSLGIGI